LEFRHFATYATAVMLDWDQMAPLALQAQQVLAAEPQFVLNRDLLVEEDGAALAEANRRQAVQQRRRLPARRQRRSDHPRKSPDLGIGQGVVRAHDHVIAVLPEGQPASGVAVAAVADSDPLSAEAAAEKTVGVGCFCQLPDLDNQPGTIRVLITAHGHFLEAVGEERLGLAVHEVKEVPSVKDLWFSRRPPPRYGVCRWENAGCRR